MLLKATCVKKIPMPLKSNLIEAKSEEKILIIKIILNVDKIVYFKVLIENQIQICSRLVNTSMLKGQVHHRIAYYVFYIFIHSA